MQHERVVVGTMMVFVIAGLFFLGKGITGMVVMDETVKPICESDAGCALPEVCCLFSGQEAGVCHLPENCGLVLELTEQIGQEALPLPTEKENANNFLGGILMIVLVAIALYLYRGRKAMPAAA